MPSFVPLSFGEIFKLSCYLGVNVMSKESAQGMAIRKFINQGCICKS